MAFRSPGSRPSPRMRKQDLADGPIQDFTTVIQCTITEDWQKRTSALQALVALIPATYENASQEDWYNSPPSLRHLASPLSDLLKDARSTVVKRTCESLGELFSKCRSASRYLMKDLMPTVCQVHGCTVQVIRNYVQIMVLESFPKVHCKMAMPIWLDRLRTDKSRTMREACSLYLSTAMAEWGAADDDDFENENNGYLSREIYHQVGGTLIKCLRDRSPIVRQHCKKGLEILNSQKREVLDELVKDNDLSRDMRVLKLLKLIQSGTTGLGDDMSVSSRMSRSSVASAPVTRGSHHSRATSSRRGVPPRAHYKTRRPNALESLNQSPPPRIPSTIGVSPSAGRLPAPSRKVDGKSPPKAKPPLLPKSSPLMIEKPVPASPGTPRDIPTSPPSNISLSTPTKKLLGASINKEPSTPVTPLEYEVKKYQSNEENEIAVNQSFESTDTDVSVLKPIANAEELRKKAKSRTKGPSNRRRSSLLQDRLLRSPKPPISTSPKKVSFPAMDVSRLSLNEIANNPQVRIHTTIAYELLEAHKLHVDQIMETLKVEMDALKDFELIMLEKGPIRPTEEEVLEYFESLGLCLDQRKKAGSIMQKKMDRISQG